MLSVRTKVNIVVGGTALVSFTAGAVVSYLFTKAKYEALAEREIAEAKVFYSKLNKTDEFSSPRNLVGEYDEFLVDVGYKAELTTPSETEEFVEFETPEEHESGDLPFDGPRQPPLKHINTDESELNRLAGKPYVISHDEFYVNDDDLEQITLTYFSGDDVLCDEQDAPIDDVDGVIGNRNLSYFGYGSKDNNVVYIRNDHYSVLYEVVQNKGNYTREVLGFIEHSEHRGPRRFRRDYE